MYARNAWKLIRKERNLEPNRSLRFVGLYPSKESHFQSNRTKFVKICEFYKGLHGSFGKRSCAAAKSTRWLGICHESGCSSSDKLR